MKEITRLIKELNEEALKSGKASILAEKNKVFHVAGYHAGYRDCCNQIINKLKKLKHL